MTNRYSYIIHHVYLLVLLPFTNLMFRQLATPVHSLATHAPMKQHVCLAMLEVSISTLIKRLSAFNNVRLGTMNLSLLKNVKNV